MVLWQRGEAPKTKSCVANYFWAAYSKYLFLEVVACNHFVSIDNTSNIGQSNIVTKLH